MFKFEDDSVVVPSSPTTTLEIFFSQNSERLQALCSRPLIRTLLSSLIDATLRTAGFFQGKPA
jgi:hypothetical protein